MNKLHFISATPIVSEKEGIKYFRCAVCEDIFVDQLYKITAVKNVFDFEGTAELYQRISRQIAAKLPKVVTTIGSGEKTQVVETEGVIEFLPLDTRGKAYPLKDVSTLGIVKYNYQDQHGKRHNIGLIGTYIDNIWYGESIDDEYLNQIWK